MRLEKRSLCHKVTHLRDNLPLLSNGTSVVCRIDANRRPSHVPKKRHRVDVLRRESVARRERPRGVRGLVLLPRDRREGTSDAERGRPEI